MLKKFFVRYGRIALMLLMDMALVNLAMLLSIHFRYNMYVPASQMAIFRHTMPWMTGCCAASFFAFRLYHSAWRYAGVEALAQIVLATLVGAVAGYLCGLIGYTIQPKPNVMLFHRPTYLLFWIFLVLFIGGSRLALRVAGDRSALSFFRAGKDGQRRVMIVGAGYAGASVIREMQAGRHGSCCPVVAVDDDERRIGTRINGVPVRGGTDRVAEYAKQYRVSEIIVAIATPRGSLNQLIAACVATGCRVRRVSRLEDLTEEKRAVTAMRDININDLLGRAEEKLDMTAVSAFFAERCVLITGGGGSIGSELCRQILPFGPRRIVLYDISENYLHDLRAELIEAVGEQARRTLTLCVGSIRDEARLNEVFGQYRPEVVLHAAAHKHVPLMEDCPEQAVKNNVFGTWMTAQCAIQHGVKRFVMISTDKAVNPTNVMGATKRCAERIVEALNLRGQTEFTAVRFGNVLGSHGSVVPLFERQIRAGGPVTLTHPDIIRYFMTIPEAAGLVLQSAAIARGGELFVLDMGEPVRIRDLAERMIQLYADPDGPKVEITYTGLRPGEKLYEELLRDDENVTRTALDKVFIAKPEVVSEREVTDMLAMFERCFAAGGDMRACLHAVVPSFLEPDEVNERAREEHRLKEERSGAVGAKPADAKPAGAGVGVGAGTDAAADAKREADVPHSA